MYLNIIEKSLKEWPGTTITLSTAILGYSIWGLFIENPLRVQNENVNELFAWIKEKGFEGIKQIEPYDPLLRFLVVCALFPNIFVRLLNYYANLLGTLVAISMPIVSIAGLYFSIKK
jgi:hypothetical protein